MRAFALGNPDFWLNLRVNDAIFSQKHAQSSAELPEPKRNFRFFLPLWYIEQRRRHHEEQHDFS
jgi:hypothetical protein